MEIIPKMTYRPHSILETTPRPFTDILKPALKFHIEMQVNPKHPNNLQEKNKCRKTPNLNFKICYKATMFKTMQGHHSNNKHMKQ